MIQRIQSIFLFLTVVLCVLMFFYPLAVFLNDLGYYKLYVYDFVSMGPDPQTIFSQYFALPMSAVVAVIAILSIITLFMYKNRLGQMRLIKTAIFLNIVLIVGILLGYVGIIERKLNIQGNYDVAAFFPLITLIFLVIAYRGVRKDEKLVRSADRLR